MRWTHVCHPEWKTLDDEVKRLNTKTGAVLGKRIRFMEIFDPDKVYEYQTCCD